MLTFKQFIEEELRSKQKALKLFNRFQKRHPRSLASHLLGGHGFGKENPLAGGKQKNRLRSLVLRVRHYPDNPRKRPTPVERTVDIKSLRPTQPGINGETVKKYIKHYSENPEEAKKATIHTYPSSKKGTLNIGDGHHRTAALRALGYDEINVLHFER